VKTLVTRSDGQQQQLGNGSCALHEVVWKNLLIFYFASSAAFFVSACIRIIVTIRECCLVVHVHLVTSVCMSVCPVWTLNFSKP